MKILIISPCFCSGGGAIANILELLLFRKPQEEMTVTVLTFIDTIGQIQEEMIADTLVYRALDIEKINAVNIYRMKWSLDKVIYLFKKVYLAFVRLLPQYGFLPRNTISALSKMLNKINIYEYDAIVPICGNYSMYEAIRKYSAGKKGVPPTIVYQVDPLSECAAYEAKTIPARRKFENEMYIQSAAVITTPIIRKEKVVRELDLNRVFELQFPAVRNMNIYGAREIEKQPGDIVCLYTGNLYESIRNPKYALEVFSRIENEKIKLLIIGSGSEALLDEYGNGALKGRLIRMGRISLDDSLGYIRSADVLLNIGNSVINMIPSKLFDYISTGKPIISTYKNRECPTLEYLSKYENAISIFEDNSMIDTQAKLAEKFIDNHYGITIPYEQIAVIYRECTADYVANEFFSIVKNTINNYH